MCTSPLTSPTISSNKRSFLRTLASQIQLWRIAATSHSLSVSSLHIFIMQVFMRWRSVFVLKSTMAQPTGGIAATAAASMNYLATFHSNNACFDKRKTKFEFVQQDVRERQKPPKDYIRYSVRQKGRGCSTKKAESFSRIETGYAELHKKSRIKRDLKAKRASQQKFFSKLRKQQRFEDFDDDHERAFRASFGKHAFTWTFRGSEMGSDWTEFSHWNYHKFGEAHSNRFDSDDNSYIVGSYEDRKTLGLPETGPLTVEGVKSAFRLSALKWHPDKHQEGSSRAAAEEKFKICVNAYKSLCDALSAP